MKKHLPLHAVVIVLLILCAVPSARAERVMWLPEGGGCAEVRCGDFGETGRLAAEELRGAWRGSRPVALKLNPDAGLGPEGFVIRTSADSVTVSAETEHGLLYGAYRLLGLGADELGRDTVMREAPAVPLRVLNHWDNPDGTVERGYAGASLWKWDQLPDTLSPRYREYARANASVGINGTVLNNVNASPRMLEPEYLRKAAALADIFRPYGIRVYLSVNFASPMRLGGLPTADPLNPGVAEWWSRKCGEIYTLIPDFGGFLVKANSEGQPGPCDYGRTHAEGANMLARALRPHGGTVIWRAFVYTASDDDRAKQAYTEFTPLDGSFDPNVIVQVKNGPIDFQPREPFSPLFGAMPSTPLMAELQITQEYLGQANHLVFLGPMWEEFFGDVPAEGLAGVAGVANVGDGAMWTGHPFGQANWYAFGRMAWNPRLSARDVAGEWVGRSLGLPPEVADTIAGMMTASREAAVDYMMPLGLHHLFAFGHHYGPEPWCGREGARRDWLPPYYHNAGRDGIGFDRTRGGSGATAQYPEPYATLYDDPSACPERLLLWFHHLPWDHRMKSGATLWDELCRHYERGVRAVGEMRATWEAARPWTDPALHADVARRLAVQERDAVWWKDACLLYFGELSGLPWPGDVTPPVHTLPALKQVRLGITNHESPSPELLDAVR